MDISELDRTPAALLESEERFRALVMASSNVLYLMSPDWGEMLNLKGMDHVAEDEKPNRDWLRRYIPKDEQPRVLAAIQEAIRCKSVFELEHQVIQVDGTLGWASSRAVPLFDGHHEIIEWIGAGSNITARKRAEEALRESEEKFRILSDTAPALIWFDDPDGNCLTVNQSYLNFTGKTADEVTGTGWRLILHEDDADAYLSAFQTAITERRSFHHLVRAKRFDGEWRWLESYAKPLLALDGTFLGLVGISPDITDRVRAEHAWRKSEERLRLMVESVEDYAIFTMNNEGLIETWNIGAERLFGYREDEIIGQHGKIIFTPEDCRRGVPAKELRTACAEGSAEDERWHIRKDGSRFYASGVLASLREGDVVTGYVKIARDLTEQKRATVELRRAHDVLEDKVRERTNELAAANELLRGEISERIQTENERVDLLRQIVRAQEDERRRIARDIHDQLGQQMTALRLNLEMLDQGCRENEEMRLILEQAKVIAEQLDADVDFLAWELRPVALDDIGLVEALNNYVREWSKHSGVKAEFHAAGVEKKRLSPETETNLYRITQEALNNIMKYARATHVAVMLERRGHQVSLIVEDNGIGFNLRKEVSGGRDRGVGLIGMRERAVLVGGTLEIESKLKEGTTIFARVPVEFPIKGEHHNEQIAYRPRRRPRDRP